MVDWAERHCEAETFIIVTDCRGLTTGAKALSNIWLQIASLNRGWRVANVDVDDAVC